MRYIICFILAASVFTSCRYVGGKRVRGNGVVITSERTISGFEGIETLGSFDVTLVPAAATSVKVETDENLLQYIETYVDGGDLKIKTRDDYNLRPRRDIRITVSGPVFTNIETKGSGSIVGQGTLNSDSEKNVNLEVAGSGNIDVEIRAAKVDAKISGSGNITVKGESKAFDGAIYGSGNLRAGKLQTEDASVKIAGSGNAEVFATGKLDVHVMGSGDVKHRGNAQVNTKISGSGSVVKID